MSYVDGFVVVVPIADREAYRAVAENAAEVFKAQGAPACVECWGDEVPEGEVTSFGLAVRREPNEAVVFAWMVWPSKDARNEGWTKSMADPRMPRDPSAMPFDGERMIYGGFEPIVEAVAAA